MVLTLGLASWATALLVALFLLICLVLILTILIQRPQGGGLSGAFGSNSGSGQTAFGAKTGDALTIATIGMFVVYVLFAIGLNYAVRPSTAVDEPPTATSTNTPANGAAPTGDAPATTDSVTTTPPTTPPATEPAPATPTGDAPSTPAPGTTPTPAPAGEPGTTPAAPPATPPATPPTTPPATPGQ